MYVQEILRKLDLGNSVAEFDNGLERYFVETDTFHSLVNDRVDIIAGDKGVGKTAIYKYLERHYTKLPELSNIELITGFNPSGSPVFQRLAHTEPLEEGQYITIWKTYIFSLVGNWLLQLCEGSGSEKTRELASLLDQIGLRSSKDETPQTIFSGLIRWVQRILNPKAGGLEVSFDGMGMPILKPIVEFGNVTAETTEAETNFVHHDDALHLLDTALAEHDITIWVALDRLDESFVGFFDVEIPALRALFRTYLDLLAFKHIKLKIFVRKDLFRKIAGNQFINLTHINARKREIIWDDDDLFALLCRRIRKNESFLALVNLPDISDTQLFYKIFPEQVDVGLRRPTTWNWILSRTKDGNGSISPRNLIDLVNKAIEEQLRYEQRRAQTYTNSMPLLEPASIKQAFVRLSKERVEDTLLAEASKDVFTLIEAFKDGKVEHNYETIASLFGVDVNQAKSFANILTDLGFFEQNGGSFKIPMLYREGLNITQGKAF